MLAQLGAILAAVRSVADAIFGIGSRTFTCVTIVALPLWGCMPTTGPLAGADPSDPGAKVAGAGYRSTIAPYTSLRPTAPGSWREQNERAAPAPKSDR
jgi:hypothetical protein